MKIPIKIPNVGFEQPTVRLVSWLVQEGERVRLGDAIAELETEKTNVEFEAPGDGTLVGLLCAAGEEVEVGHVIGYIDDGT